MGQLFLRFKIALRVRSLISFHACPVATFAEAVSPFEVKKYDNPFCAL